MNINGVKKFLGEPYYERENCIIYNSDCLSSMQKLPGEIVDLTITSPPYNIGKEYEEVLPLDDYISWCESWIKEVYRLTNNNGAFWLNLGYLSIKDKAKAIPIPYLLWEKIPFYLIQEVVWHYTAGVAGRRFLSPRNEKFLWYVKNKEDYIFNLDDIRNPNVKYPNQKKNGKKKCNPKGKNPTDVWTVPKVTSGRNRSSAERTPHPAQFPVSVIARIILGSSNKNQIILDPFIGSGSTAEAALDKERQILGFEINTSYCDIASERIDDFLEKKAADKAQIRLFPIKE